MLVGVDQGYRATGEISYGGPGCLERARRAEEILRAHLEALLGPGDEVRIDLQGLNSLFGDQEGTAYPSEVRLRLAVRTEPRSWRATPPTRSSCSTSGRPAVAGSSRPSCRRSA